MEMTKALVEADQPRMFFDILCEISALSVVFPEIDRLRNVPAGPPEYHKEGSAYEHTMMVLEEMNNLRPNDEKALLMAISHDLGKGVTSDESLPSHPGHEKAGVSVVESMADRLSMSNDQLRAMRNASLFHMNMHKIERLNESTVIEMCESLSDEHIEILIDLAIADSKGRDSPRETKREPIVRRLDAARHACDEITGQQLIKEGYTPEAMGGDNFGSLLRQRRVELMREVEASRKS
jgi:tRNA nucleotidyltransferase (CCA-adding enzyme)